MVDRLRFVAEVKPVKFDLGFLQVLVHLALVEVDAELYCFAPSYGDDGVALISESGCQSVTPVEVRYRAWLDVRWPADRDEWECPRAHLRYVHLL